MSLPMLDERLGQHIHNEPFFASARFQRAKPRFSDATFGTNATIIGIPDESREVRAAPNGSAPSARLKVAGMLTTAIRKPCLIPSFSRNGVPE
jgi:hypothetical protein